MNSDLIQVWTGKIEQMQTIEGYKDSSDEGFR